MPPSAGKAQLFVDRDYGGKNGTLDVGEYNISRLKEKDQAGNDTVSSLKVAPGYAVIAYTDANFQGDSKEFTADTPYVGDAFNDKISSVKVRAASAAKDTEQNGDDWFYFEDSSSG
ncbi:peptidase inhibitor family I36 protein [Nocardia tengchongensis]|uniref:peptidase inhibitor family I36 protein n=1 Tax=Nocardia tengchongensis TaxID=2055889 RepID=UPI00369F39D6